MTDKDENDDDNVWNASAVILDIDSGFSCQNYIDSHSHFLNFILICHVNVLSLLHKDFSSTLATHIIICCPCIKS